MDLALLLPCCLWVRLPVDDEVVNAECRTSGAPAGKGRCYTNNGVLELDGPGEKIPLRKKGLGQIGRPTVQQALRMKTPAEELGEAGEKHQRR